MRPAHAGTPLARLERNVRALAALALAAATLGCASFDPQHPCLGTPRIDEEHAGYWIYYSGSTWRLTTTGGTRAHRFQGTIAGVTGSVAGLALSDASLTEHAAVVGDAIQFDFEQQGGRRGFDFPVVGGCARFDLILDGKRHPERVHLGGRGKSPGKIPFERCP
jgi:hypothetical protein